jgi:hypothetical protein
MKKRAMTIEILSIAETPERNGENFILISLLTTKIVCRTRAVEDMPSPQSFNS